MKVQTALLQKWKWWKNGDPPWLSLDLQEHLGSWFAQLKGKDIIVYASAFEALMLEGMLREGDKPGQLLLERDPAFRVLGQSGKPANISTALFAQRIADKCGLRSLSWGELAWRFFVASLPQSAELCPRLRFQANADGSYKVERVPETD